jgi:hypothetical protein
MNQRRKEKAESWAKYRGETDAKDTRLTRRPFLTGASLKEQARISAREQAGKYQKVYEAKITEQELPEWDGAYIPVYIKAYTDMADLTYNDTAGTWSNGSLTVSAEDFTAAVLELVDELRSAHELQTGQRWRDAMEQAAFEIAEQTLRDPMRWLCR